MRIRHSLYESVICMLVYLLIAFLGSLALLALMSLLLFLFQISAKLVSIMIIAVYIMMPCVAGYLMGRKMGHKKFLYGAMMGMVYFLVLCIFSAFYGEVGITASVGFFTTAILCIGGGTLGGMLG